MIEEVLIPHSNVDNDSVINHHHDRSIQKLSCNFYSTNLEKYNLINLKIGDII